MVFLLFIFNNFIYIIIEMLLLCNLNLNRISKHNKEKVLHKAENDLVAVTNQYISRVVRELQAKFSSFITVTLGFSEKT